MSVLARVMSFLEVLLKLRSSENHSTVQNYWPNSYPLPSNSLHEKIYSLKQIIYDLSGIYNQHFFVINQICVNFEPENVVNNTRTGL